MEQTTTILQVCRDALRRSSTALDETELNVLITDALEDLRSAGVNNNDDTDKVIQSTVRLYVLGRVEKDDNIMNNYERKKASLATNSNYNTVIDDE